MSETSQEIPIEQFSDGFEALVKDFRAWYKKEQEANPENYPERMNAAEWQEQFFTWLELDDGETA
jgi:hypothetical protein